MKKETLSSNIKRNFEFLKEIGSTKDQILNMTVSFPVIYGYSIENINQKIEDMIDLGYARYEYLTKEKNIRINYENYRKFFQGAKKFEKQYGIKKSDLLQKYPYGLESEKKHVRAI